jgi:ubiquinone/menaquinone biosynthesis C-methylase UbiE
MNHDELLLYWNQRAGIDNTPQSTTQDVYLREIEKNVLTKRIAELKPRRVLDVGCGDGRLLLSLINKYPNIEFNGCDFSPKMISNAETLNTKYRNNLQFFVHDINFELNRKYDLVFSSRCLINLESWKNQKQALVNISNALNPKGSYLMIENFEEGQKNFNEFRKKLGLPEISIREHNVYFNRKKLESWMSPLFALKADTNISSTYYFVTRGIYSLMCMQESIEPNYYHPIHESASTLPFMGEFGPIRFIEWKKREENEQF